MLQPVLIVGSGALACFFAAKLSASGQKVKILGTWEESLAALRDKGVRFIDLNEREYTYPVEVSSNPNDCKGSLFVLVLVKSWQTQRAAQQLSQCLDNSGIALTLQNGLGNYDILSEYLGKNRVLVGSTTIGASLIEPGCVKLNGSGKIFLGNHQNIKSIQRLLQKAGFNIYIQDNINNLLWGKLIINAAINPLTAILQVKNGLLDNNASALSLMNKIIKESLEVAAAMDISLPYEDPMKIVIDVIRQTADNTSSMLYDWTRCSPTEIDAITGSIINYAEKLGIETPYNKALYLLVKAHYYSKKYT